MVFVCVFDALATTMATFAGQNVGARKLDRINEGLKSASILGIAYCVLALITIWLVGKQLITLFVSASDTEVVEKAYNFLLINAVFYIPLLFVNIVRLSIQGMGFTQMAVIAGFCEMVARIFVAVVLCRRSASPLRPLPVPWHGSPPTRSSSPATSRS